MEYVGGDSNRRKKGMVDQTKLEGFDCKFKEVTFNTYDGARKIQIHLPPVDCSFLCLGLRGDDKMLSVKENWKEL